jgi:hypothetical protein
MLHFVQHDSVLRRTIGLSHTLLLKERQQILRQPGLVRSEKAMRRANDRAPGTPILQVQFCIIVP